MTILRVLCLVVLGFLAACTDGPSDEEFESKLEGELADPAGFELDIISCVNDGEFIRYEWGITNTSAERKTFAFDPYFTNAEGEEEKKLRELVAESVAPGEYMQWDGGAGGGERFDIGDVECRFEVYDSVLGAFRDEE